MPGSVPRVEISGALGGAGGGGDADWALGYAGDSGCTRGGGGTDGALGYIGGSCGADEVRARMGNVQLGPGNLGRRTSVRRGIALGVLDCAEAEERGGNALVSLGEAIDHGGCDATNDEGDVAGDMLGGALGLGAEGQSDLGRQILSGRLSSAHSDRSMARQASQLGKKRHRWGIGHD
ncbi:unnamed protein product [Ilex paraguariensis]|uniref:Uncharacterized protein n=1 Tax=Ilex paraguariensis TaxID=185542 RepID=A0ABC8T8H4_9AQUA